MALPEKLNDCKAQLQISLTLCHPSIGLYGRTAIVKSEIGSQQVD